MCVMYLQKWLFFLWALSHIDFGKGILPDDTTILEDPEGEIFCTISKYCKRILFQQNSEFTKKNHLHIYTILSNNIFFQ